MAEYYMTEDGRRRRIVRRIPHTMFAEVTVAAATSGQSFNSGDLEHAMSEPFEIHRLYFNVTTLDSGAIPQADPNIGKREFVKVTVELTGGSKKMTHSAHRLSDFGSADSRVWDWEEPLVLDRSEGFSITADNSLAASAAAGGVRVEASFYGYLLVLGDFE